MSNFFSLDDDDDEQLAGPSRQTGVLSNSTPVKNGSATRRANPIAAMLSPQQGGHQNSRRPDLVDDEDDLEIEMNGSSTERPLAQQRKAPVAILRQSWANERAAPALLPWQGEAVDGVCSQIEEQVNIIDSLAADSGTAEEEHVRLALVELDVERARWLLRSYLRCRLDKIEQNAAFVCQDPISRSNLSELERGYAVKFNQIRSQHFHSSVLDFLPETMQSLEDRAASGSSGRGDMVTRPDLDAPVFVHCLEGCGTFRFPGIELLVHFEKGSVHLVRFRSVQHLIATGKIVLL
ncbi:Sld5-domain-containing protein [Meira miltonrushii]|uniref:DNA replication complex GINS protein SLD5 n=1 Tax=Meira miltonrushii TaxID=1280837 RepID=A0A316VCB2_9BASI|nr:Sld5-domain-containing protein [Meira miltonrushii]PWN35269.1 Sld5-domain-containing protein [Meira miltonrushii]